MPNQNIDTKKLKEFYDGVYAKGDIRDNDKLYAWIVKLFRLEKGKKFLDVGCGSDLPPEKWTQRRVGVSINTGS